MQAAFEAEAAARASAVTAAQIAQGALETSNQQLSAVTADLARTRDELDCAHTRLNEASGQLTHAQAQLECVREGNAALQGVATQQNDAVDWLAGEVDEQRGTIDRLTADLGEAIARADALTSQLAHAQAQCAAAHAGMAMWL